MEKTWCLFVEVGVRKMTAFEGIEERLPKIWQTLVTSGDDGLAPNTQWTEVAARCLRCARVHSVYSTNDTVQLGAVFWVHPVFFAEKSGMSKEENLVLKLFPNVSTALEKVCIFKTSILVKLTVLA